MKEQFNFEGTDEQAMEFVNYLVTSCKKAHVDVLDCDVSFARQLSDKSFDDVIEMIDNSHISVQINREPYFKLRDYEKWEGGYIESCLRTMTTPDYFIWTYHKVDKLDEILKQMEI